MFKRDTLCHCAESLGSVSVTPYISVPGHWFVWACRPTLVWQVIGLYELDALH